MLSVSNVASSKSLLNNGFVAQSKIHAPKPASLGWCSLKGQNSASRQRMKPRVKNSMHSSLFQNESVWGKLAKAQTLQKSKSEPFNRSGLVVRSFFGIGEAIAAGVILMGSLITVPVAIGLGVATVATAWGILVTFLTLSPVLGLILFTMTPLKLSLALISGGLFLLLDRIAGTFIVLNFGGAIASAVANSLKRDNRENYVSSNYLQLTKPRMAMLLTLVPGFGWFPWIWALFDSKRSLTLGRKLSLIKNAVFYGGFSLFTVLLTGRVFDAPGNGLVLSQVLGSLHFILLQSGFLDNALLQENVSDEDSASSKVWAANKAEVEKKAKTLSAEAEEILRRRKELAEFDLKLGSSNNTLSSANPRMVLKWSVSDVVDWLESEKLSQHAVTIVQHDVDGRVLMSLSEDDLKDELGVVSLGERRRFIDGIATLRKQAQL